MVVSEFFLGYVIDRAAIRYDVSNWSGDFPIFIAQSVMSKHSGMVLSLSLLSFSTLILLVGSFDL